MKKVVVNIILCYCFMICSAYSAYIVHDNYQKDMVEYSTKNHPRSNNLDIRIKYPKNWKQQEGVEKYIVQTFSDNDFNECLISSYAISATITQEDYKKIHTNPDFMEEIGNIVKQSSNIYNPYKLNIIPTKYDGLLGYYVEFSGEVEKLGVKFFIYNVTHMFLYNNTINMVMCITGDESIYRATQKFEKIYPLFKLIGNTIIVYNK